MELTKTMDNNNQPLDVSDSETLAALCIYTEAGNQPFEGKVAVGVVLRKRMADQYESDGSVPGTVLAYDQFSDFYFEMVNGRYTRVASTVQQATDRAQDILNDIDPDTQGWKDCVQAWQDSAPGSGYQAGPELVKLAETPRAYNYVNLSISKPVWASADKFVTKIGAHSFYTV